MTKVLLVDDDQDILMLLSLVIQAKMECTLFTATKGIAALEILEKEEIDVIVSDYNLGGMTGGELCQNAIAKNPNLSYVILSADAVDSKDDVKKLFKLSENGLFILKPFENDQLVFIISHITKEKCQDFIDGDFISVIAPAVLTAFKDQAIYFRVNDKKLIKILSEGDERTEEKINEYMGKGADHFWVHRNSFRNIIEDKLKMISEKLANNNDVDFQIMSTSAIHQTIKYLGIDQQIIGVSDKVIENVVSTVQKDKKIWDLLADAMKGQGYIYKHAMLTSYLSVGIFENMEWNFDQAPSKLVTASLFQDIGLVDDSHAQIVDSKEYKMLPEKQRCLVKNHPKDACKTVEKINGIYFDFHNLLLYHHERPGCSTFHAPINFDQLGNLEKIFVIAVETAQRILKHQELDYEQLEREFVAIEEIFSGFTFKKPLQAFKDLLGRLAV